MDQQQQQPRNALPTGILSNLFKDPECADVHFIFPNELHDKCHCDCDCETMAISIPAHRTILAQGSRKFREMFYGETKCPDSDVFITNYSSAAFAEFLQMFYLTEVSLNEAHITDVLQLIVDHQMDRSICVCETFMMQSVSVENCLHYMHLALTYNLCVRLLGILRQFIRVNAIYIFQTDGFRHCSMRLLENILELRDLKCSEGDVFFAAMDWARWLCLTNCIDITDENRRKMLGACFNLIRFPTMTVEDFSRCLVRHPNLLDNVELLDILQYITSKKPLSVATSFSSLPRMID